MLGRKTEINKFLRFKSQNKKGNKTQEIWKKEIINIRT